MDLVISSGSCGARLLFPICLCPVSELPCIVGSRFSKPTHIPDALVGNDRFLLRSSLRLRDPDAQGTYLSESATDSTRVWMRSTKSLLKNCLARCISLIHLQASEVDVLGAILSTLTGYRRVLPQLELRLILCAAFSNRCRSLM